MCFNDYLKYVFDFINKFNPKTLEYQNKFYQFLSVELLTILLDKKG